MKRYFHWLAYLFRSKSDPAKTGGDPPDRTPIALIQDGILYCLPLAAVMCPSVSFVPELPVSESVLLLSTGPVAGKSSPVLIQWSVAGDGNDGVMEVVNIDPSLK